jgi:undecaprenyl-diphosphatase
MSIIEAIILGIVQGLTEFLPVSSSGHLLILQKWLGVDGSGITFDVALHLGTLLALLLHFRKDLVTLVKGARVPSKERRLLLLLGLATIPAAILGYLLEDAAESSFRSPLLVAINLSVFGALMLAAEAFAKRYNRPREILNISQKQALIMGFAQSLAIVPGVSRSGSTITAGLAAGLDRIAATRFSFLLGIPIISGAALKVMLSSEGLAAVRADKDIFAIGIATAFLSGLLAIRFMLSYLAKHDLSIFAYYRFFVAGIIIFALVI